MNGTLDDLFVKAAAPLALSAGARMMSLRRSPLSRQRKADHSIVTNADLAADRILREGLRRAFPDHAILTEESGLQGDAAAEYLWVVDPLDGTRAYARGASGFSVMVGLLRRGEPFAGIVFDPSEGHLFAAVRGGGAFVTQNNETHELHVSGRKEWTQMPLITSTGFPERYRAAIVARLPCPWIPPVNSVGVKVGIVVRQLADLYLNHHHVHLWDTCAPQVILEEAGGRMSYLDGAPLRYDLQQKNFRHPLPTLAGNNQRHDEALDIFRSVLMKP